MCHDYVFGSLDFMDSSTIYMKFLLSSISAVLDSQVALLRLSLAPNNGMVFLREKFYGNE